MTQVSETAHRGKEWGYPHELILFAISKTRSVIEEGYRLRIKLTANLLRKIVGEGTLRIDDATIDDAELKLLSAFCNDSAITFTKAIDNFDKKLGQLLKDYNDAQSSSSHKALVDFVQNGIILHVFAREVRKTSLFSNENLLDFLRYIEVESDLKSLIEATQLWSRGDCDSVPDHVILGLASCKSDILVDSAIFLTFALANHCQKNKNQLLAVHYELTKLVAEGLKESLYPEKEVKLSDETYERLFRVAVALYLCGYFKSIRLPYLEKILYSKEIIKTPSIENDFEVVLENKIKVTIPGTDTKLPLWSFALLSATFLVIHWFYEFRLPYSFSLLGLQFSYPEIPVFLFLSVSFSVIVFWRLLALKKNIMENIRKGSTK